MAASRPGNIRWSGSNWSLIARIKAAPEVMAACGTYGTLAASGAAVPGAALMRAVKDQFDPDHRMFPSRLEGS